MKKQIVVMVGTVMMSLLALAQDPRGKDHSAGIETDSISWVNAINGIDQELDALLVQVKDKIGSSSIGFFFNTTVRTGTTCATSTSHKYSGNVPIFKLRSGYGNKAEREIEEALEDALNEQFDVYGATSIDLEATKVQLKGIVSGHCPVTVPSTKDLATYKQNNTYIYNKYYKHKGDTKSYVVPGKLGLYY